MFTDGMTNLFTDDVNRLTEFYRDLIGFTQTYQFPPEGQPEHVEFRLNGYRLALSTRSAALRVGLPEATPGSPIELVFWCDDLDTEFAALTAAGAPVIIAPADHVAGNRRASVADPDGNWVTLTCKKAA